MDAVNLLVEDHHKVEQLFEQFESAPATDPALKARLAEQICKELSVHAAIEEELFYPKARECLDSSEEDMVEEAIDEHADAKDMISQIKTMSTGPELDAAMKELSAAIKHHVTEEEDEMFPKLKDLGMEMTKLGSDMMQRKSQLISTL